MPPQSPSPRALALLALLALLAHACSSEGDSGSSAAQGVQASSGRFQDCGGETLLDASRNLQWELKTGISKNESQTAKGCESRPQQGNIIFYRTCEDTRDVNNRYTYCANIDTRMSNCDGCQGGGIRPTGPLCTSIRDLRTGSVFFDFFGTLNGTNTTEPCFANHCDWRLPTADELKSIMVGAGATADQPQNCVPGTPCIDGAFGENSTAKLGSFYWTSELGQLPVLSQGNQSECRNQQPCQTSANFGIGGITTNVSTMGVPSFVRAVRDFQPGDSCGP